MCCTAASQNAVVHFSGFKATIMQRTLLESIEFACLMSRTYHKCDNNDTEFSQNSIKFNLELFLQNSISSFSIR